MKYAIYLISSGGTNAYGYWSGKSYTHQGEMFPTHTYGAINSNTRIYTSKKLAENAAAKCADRYSYVVEAKVIKVAEFITEVEE